MLQLRRILLARGPEDPPHCHGHWLAERRACGQLQRDWKRSEFAVWKASSPLDLGAVLGKPQPGWAPSLEALIQDVDSQGLEDKTVPPPFLGQGPCVVVDQPFLWRSF